MNLYWVVRWGSEDSPDGLNGFDTNFVVRANGHEEAASLVDELLQAMPHERVPPWCHSVRELGTDKSPDPAAKVVIGTCGPAYEYAYNRATYREWSREHQEDEWSLAQHEEGS